MSMICLSDFFTCPEPPAGESRTDLHRDLRVVRDGAKQPPPGLARDLITHVLNRQQRQQPSRFLAMAGPPARLYLAGTT
jgi:hypothetical protein